MTNFEVISSAANKLFDKPSVTMLDENQYRIEIMSGSAAFGFDLIYGADFCFVGEVITTISPACYAEVMLAAALEYARIRLKREGMIHD